MKQYLKLLRQVKNAKPEDRRGHMCRAIPSAMIVHDLADGFPVLTTKKIHMKSVAVELEGFIKGITNANWYQDRGCRIWNEWAKEDGDLGPIYGYQWRSFNDRYHKADNMLPAHRGTGPNDQLTRIVDTLVAAPLDRRMVCLAWNPLQIDQMALPACHIGWMVTVIEDRLHLTWWQRSCDLFLGIPFNLASYALLLELLAKEAEIKPGMVTGHLTNVHLYEDHMAQVDEQLARRPRPLPKIQAPKLWSFDHTKLSLIGYDPHPTIQAKVNI